ncbi:hypothetical protein ACPWT1_05795 [Ramlibacter sp. MMS24-I3-19]|uniref:hypothetical protein n=1 Tax=Ramlibacter sp. MMS24-I3-19 TaxID=3416606 RepID=UPI003CFE6759
MTGRFELLIAVAAAAVVVWGLAKLFGRRRPEASPATRIDPDGPATWMEADGPATRIDPVAASDFGAPRS